MFCSKCGAQMPDGSTFCPACGSKCGTATATGARMIRLKCRNCNGDLDVDADKGEYTCPFCGDREKLVDSDAVTIEKLKNNTYKEIEYAKMANEKEKDAYNEKKEYQKAYRKSKFSKVTMVFLFISFVMALTSFSSHYVMSGIIALIQTGLFAVSWLMGMQIIREKKKFVYMALAVLGFLLFVPFTAFHNSKAARSDRLIWPDDGLAVYLPVPDVKYGYVLTNDKDDFYASIEHVSDDTYMDYIDECKKKGFDVDASTTSSSYEADNKEGYHLSISFYAEDMTISLVSPEEQARRAANATSEATTEKTRDDSEDTLTEKVSEEEATEEDETSSEIGENTAGEVDPDLKAFLDSYEAFIDEYVEFMEKYENSDDTAGMIADYAEYMSKYADFVKKLDAYNADSMSPADYAYYMEVTARCTGKLAKVAYQ